MKLSPTKMHKMTTTLSNVARTVDFSMFLVCFTRNYYSLLSTFTSISICRSIIPCFNVIHHCGKPKNCWNIFPWTTNAEL